MMKQKQLLLMTVFAMLALATAAQSDGSVFLPGNPTPTPATIMYEEAPQQRLGIIPTTRGNFMIGTGIGFSTSNSKVDVNSVAGDFSGDGGSSSQLNFSPTIGYFFATNFAFGVGMDLIASRTSSNSDFTDPNSPEQSSQNSNVLFGPFARYYLAVSTDKAFFLGATLGFGSARDQYNSATGGSQTINNNITTLGVGPGFTVFSNSGLALEALVKYNFARSVSDITIDGLTRNTSTRTHAFDFNVGIQYYFSGFRSLDTVRPNNF